MVATSETKLLAMHYAGQGLGTIAALQLLSLHAKATTLRPNKFVLAFSRTRETKFKSKTPQSLSRLLTWLGPSLRDPKASLVIFMTTARRLHMLKQSTTGRGMYSEPEDKPIDFPGKFLAKELRRIARFSNMKP